MKTTTKIFIALAVFITTACGFSKQDRRTSSNVEKIKAEDEENTSGNSSEGSSDETTNGSSDTTRDNSSDSTRDNSSDDSSDDSSGDSDDSSDDSDDSSGDSDDDSSNGSPGGGTPSTMPGPMPSGEPVTLDNVEQNRYLAYVEQYIESQTRYGQHSEDVNAYTVRTYGVGEDDFFGAASDTYDNALASIFFTVTGKPQKASKILDTWLRFHKTNLNKPELKGLFWPRFNYHDLQPAYWIDFGGEFFDVGNNSMMALAFCRYYLQFKDDAPDANLHKEYYKAAKAMMSEIHNNFQCKVGPYQGYMGRPTSTGQGHAEWQSVEHNLDMFALGACVQEAAKTAEPGVDTLADEVQQISGNFVSQMWDDAEGAYRTGTEPSCNSSTKLNDAFKPVDGITWRFLTKAEASPELHDTRSAVSMETLVTNRFMLEDSGFTSEIGTPYFGVRFTDEGWGAQQENTGAALLAMNGFYGDTPNADLDKLRTGVKAMLAHYKGEGVPAHFDTNDECNGGQGSCNTGITWSYMRWAHTASTVYFGLALGYQFERNGRIIPGMNPYYPGPSNVKPQETVIAPQL